MYSYVQLCLINIMYISFFINLFIFQDENNIEIDSVKIFDQPITIDSNLEITSNLMSDTNIFDIIDKTSDEPLPVSLIPGLLTIENLDLSGLFDDVNITELDQLSVKINGDQYVSSTIIFDESDSNLNELLYAMNMEILDTINDLNPEEFVGLYATPILFNGSFNEIVAKNLTVMSNFKSSGNEDFGLLVKRNQKFGSGSVKHLEIEKVNNMSVDGLAKMIDGVKNVKNGLRSGLLKVKGMVSRFLPETRANRVTIDLCFRNGY